MIVYPKGRGPGSGRERTIEVRPGMDVAELAAQLSGAGVIARPRVFVVYMRLLGADETLREGEVLLTDDMSPRDVLQRIAIGFGDATVRLTIPEGFHRFAVAARLERWGVCDADEFIEATEDRALLDELSIPGPSAEGYLFPDTYRIQQGLGGEDVVRLFVENYRRRVGPILEANEAGLADIEHTLGWSEHEALILASIVEKEAAVADERPIIARVFMNRLRDPDFRPKRLQADPTVSYGCLAAPDEAPSCAGFERSITRAMLQDRANRYNTYRHEGAPAGAYLQPRRGLDPRGALGRAERLPLLRRAGRRAAHVQLDPRGAQRGGRALPSRPVSQIPLFDDPLPAPDPRLTELAGALPVHLRFGTSSWTFEGWKGLVYRRTYGSKRAFVKESLREYARFPLFRCTGVDRSFYGPPTREEWAAYAAMVPEGFRFCTKVWSGVTARIVDDEPNPRFLDPRAFVELVLIPLAEGLGDALGPLIVELPPAPHRTEPRAFADAIALFLRDLPKDCRYAFEIREPQLLTPRYLDVLRGHPGASHLFNFHTRMPTIGEQLDRGALMGDTAVARLMIPPGKRYGDLQQAYAPFDRIVAPQPGMRDDVVRLVEETGRRGMEVFVIANNKAEGSSPRTVIALAERLTSRGASGPAGSR